MKAHALAEKKTKKKQAVSGEIRRTWSAPGGVDRAALDRGGPSAKAFHAVDSDTWRSVLLADRLVQLAIGEETDCSSNCAANGCRQGILDLVRRMAGEEALTSGGAACGHLAAMLRAIVCFDSVTTTDGAVGTRREAQRTEAVCRCAGGKSVDAVLGHRNDGRQHLFEEGEEPALSSA